MTIENPLPLWALTAALAVPFANAQERTVEPPKAAPPKAAAEDANVADLIEQLGDDSYRARKQAERALLELGQKAVAELEAAAAQDDDTEIQWRARRVLERIRRGERDAGGLTRRGDAPTAPRPPRAGDGTDERFDQMIERLERSFGEDAAGPGSIRDLLERMREQMGLMQRGLGQVDRAFEPPFGFPQVEMRGGSGSAFRMQVGPDGVRVEVEEKAEDGKTHTEVYEAPDMEAFREKYPEIADRYLGGRGLGFRRFGLDLGTPPRGFRVQPPGAAERPVQPLEAAPPAGRRLGVYVQSIEPEVARFLELDEGQGLIVESVQEDSLAADLGIRARDVIIEIAGRKVFGTGDVAAALGEIDAGESVSVTVNRRGRVLTLDANKRESADPDARKLRKRAEDAKDEGK